MKVDNLYAVLKNVVSDYIEDNMASNVHLSDDSLGRSVDEFHNPWEIYLEKNFHVLIQDLLLI